MDTGDPVIGLSNLVEQIQGQLDAARSAFFDLCAERVQKELDTADTIAARTFPTAVTIRKELRARGVEPLPRGPKRKQAAELSQRETEMEVRDRGE